MFSTLFFHQKTSWATFFSNSEFWTYFFKKFEVFLKYNNFWNYKELNEILSMVMMIDPNSLVREKKAAQGEGEEEAGDRRKGGQTGSPTLGADAPTGLI